MTKAIDADQRKQIGCRLKAVRAVLGMQQAEFSMKLGIAQSACSNLELGKVDLPLSIALKLSELSNVNPSWLLLGEGEMMSSKTIQVA